jgi:RNA-directed DNA polymerase
MRWPRSKRLFARLRLQVNESKSAVARVWERKFLGYSFWVAKGRVIRPRVAPAALATMKARVRQITSRNGGRSMTSVAKELRSYLTGGKLYFQLAETPRVFADLDKWLHHRLRAVQLKQWKRGTTAYRALRARGLSDKDARQGAAHVRRWWAAAAHPAFTIALPISYFDRLGVPRLAGR